MNTVTKGFVAALCLTGALASPLASEDESEMRTIYSTSGGAYLGLNTTILWVTVIGLAVLAVLALAVLPSTGLLDDLGSSGYQQRYDDYYQYQQEQPYRQKRALSENMVTKMLQLEQIFKKYSVEEDECMAYVACEAANVERLAENGPLVQQVHEFFNAVNSAKHRQHEFDICKPLREGCQGVRQKKN